MRFKDSDRPIPKIARALNVDAVLAGAVMRAADRVRISVQLIDGRTDSTLWGKRYDSDLSDVLALQSDIARSVADEISVELSADEVTALSVTPPVSPRVYDDFLRAITIFGNTPTLRTEIWAPRAIPLLERVVETDPTFARGWAALGGMLAAKAFVDGDDLQGAHYAVDRALELDDRSSSAHTARGWIQFSEWHFGSGGESWKRAIELNPNWAFAVSAYAGYLLHFTGQSKAAIELSDRLPLLDPLNPHQRRTRAAVLLDARYYEDALDEIRRMRSEFPDFVDPIEPILYRVLGRYREGGPPFQKMIHQCGERCAWAAEARARVGPDGNHEDYVRAIRDAQVNRLTEAPPPAAALHTSGYIVVAADSAWLGDFDLALEWLQQAYRDRDPVLAQIKAPHFFDPIRTDPRYQDLLRRIGYPEWEPNPGLLAETGRALALLGRVDEAIKHVQQAMALSPVDRRSARWFIAMAFAHFAAARYEEASDWCHRAIDQSRHRYTTEDAQLLLSASYAHAGRMSESKAMLDAALATWPEFTARFVPLPPYTDSVVHDQYVAGLRMAGLVAQADS